jgi:hypothetical protein
MLLQVILLNGYQTAGCGDVLFPTAGDDDCLNNVQSKRRSTPYLALQGLRSGRSIVL